MSAKRALHSLVAALLLASVASLAGCSHFVVLHDPLSASEHNDLGVAYESSGQTALAAREYARSLRLDPHQSLTWVNRGNTEAAGGRWRAAEKSYRRALVESPANSDAKNNLATALLRQRRHLAEARTLAEAAVAAGGERDSIYRATLEEVTREGR